jgi:hypothetical protein
MLLVRHLSGPLAGASQRIEPGVDRVIFGRDPQACDVVFPPSLTAVARRHFALQLRPSGDWTLDLFGDPYVELDGRPAEAGQTVRSGAVIGLGGRHGPTFTIVQESDSLDSSLPRTLPQPKPEGARAAAARTRRFALAGLAAACVALVGVSGVAYLWQREGSRLERALAALSETQAQIASRGIDPAVRDKLLQSAYVVVRRTAGGQEAAAGTAFAISPRTLGTNAHVAEQYEQMQPGERMFVRAPGSSGKLYEVIEARLHPGWRAFDAFLREDPLFVAFSKECKDCFSQLSNSNSYDVAIMRIADGPPLESVLDISSREELAAIAPGLPVAMAGYPSERITGREVLPIGATPTLSLGVITGLTDMFMLPAEPDKRRILRHNMPITGGSSGSPLVGPNGKVVGVLHLGNMDYLPNIGRLWNAALINYAQRADDLLDLAEGRAQARVEAERPYWAQQTATFRRGVEVIVPWILSKLKPQGATNPTLQLKETITLGPGSRTTLKDADGKEAIYRRTAQRVTLKAGQPGVFIAYAQQRTPLTVYLMTGDQTILAKDDRGKIWFPHFAYVPLASGMAELYVVAPDADVTLTLFHYIWDAPPS